MKKNDWRKKLHPGDAVKWNDPDEGTCSHSGTIAQIRFFDDDCAWIMMTDGWGAEVRLEELSRKEELAGKYVRLEI